MKKLIQLGSGLNAFKLNFKDELLNEIRESYFKDIKTYISDKNNQHILEGGTAIDLEIGQSSKNYNITSYGTNPLLWLSCNNSATYNIYKRFFDALEIEQEVKELVDHNKKLIMYCGFLVIGDRAPNSLWHVDYQPGANAYTLITPLFELDDDHSHLLYKTNEKITSSYKYSLNEAIIFGDHFPHTTEPYEKSNRIRILLSITFGTDKMQHWPILSKTIGTQSKFMVLPCGHHLGTCKCAEKIVHKKTGRNSPCPCNSGKKYKHCHGAPI